MKILFFVVSGLLSTFTAFAQFGVTAGLAARGFATNGAFQMEVTGGPLQIEVSTNLTTWTTLENGRDKVTDPASANAEWRFYRARTASGFASNVIGFVRIPIEPGKVGVVASPFVGTIHLDRAITRKAMFGSETPMIQFSLISNGKQTAYTWDEFSNNWSPTPPPIPWGTGILVRNIGKDRVRVIFEGELPQGNLKRSIPQGETLVGPLVPKPGPVHDAISAAGIEGAQLQMWDEQKQAYQTSSFNKQTGRWDGALQYKPGRAIVVKYPEATFQTTFSATH